jgi:hypothetical protein
VLLTADDLGEALVHFDHHAVDVHQNAFERRRRQ